MTNEEAIEILKANYPDACYSQLREAVDKAIEVLEKQISTTDVEEVRHGKWIKMRYQVYECSCCKRSVYLEGLNVADENETELLRELYPYCHCGTRMDGGKE